MTEAPAAPSASPRLPDQGGILGWVPIRSLAPRHRPRILEHLLALPPRDRYLRFGHAASDARIADYVDRIDFDRDEVFGIFNRRLQVVAMAHLALQGTTEAEFGVSVASASRGRGWGARLFGRAVLMARNRHVDTLIIHALSENAAMLHIARRAGAHVDMAGPDSTAQLKLPREDLASHVEQLVEQQAAEFDYRFKLRAQQLDAWLQSHRAPPPTPQSRAPEGRPHPEARDFPLQPPV